MRRCACLALVLALAACGGGTGDSQEPDPVVVDMAIAYVERPLPEPMGQQRERDDLLDPAAFHPGAGLWLKDRAAPGATARNITAAAFAANARYDVKDLEIAYDGSKLLFAMRAPEIENADDDEQPTWNIWEYQLAGRTLRRVIGSDITADAGQDIAPHYLADGRIVFSSTRQRQGRATLLDEGKPQYAGLDEDRDQPAFVLHVMDQDGGNIGQISFNQSHDLDPALLDSGEILFSRWDNAAGNDSVSLYRIHPDGRALSPVYGRHSQNTGSDGSAIAFVQPRSLPNGDVLALLRSTESASLGGDIARIDTRRFIDNEQALASLSGLDGPAQLPLSFQPVRTDDAPSPHGHFSAAFPLWDGTGRLLVSWSPCRLAHPQNGTIIPCTEDNLALPEVRNAAPLYGIWIYDLDAHTQKPVVRAREGRMLTDVVALEPRATPVFLAEPAAELEQDWVERGLGVINIRSVYDVDGIDTSGRGIAVLADPLQTAAADRPARFVRIVKPVAQPDDDVIDVPNSAFGRSTGQGMREIVGYGTIEPDGSVRLAVPANTPFALDVLDAEGKRIGGRHDNWLQVRPGEERHCNGCHHADSTLPHGRPEAEADSINTGAARAGTPFPNTTSDLRARSGETMAETRGRRLGLPDPTIDILYQDLWTDSRARPQDPAIEWRFRDLATPAPATSACQNAWQARCRSVINFETHIQPLWERERPQLADNGVDLLDDYRCVRCHAAVDADNAAQLPAAQLEFSGAPSADEPDHLIAYRELLFTDAEQELIDGALLDRLIQATDGAGNPLFETDNAGNLILDGAGNPIPLMLTVPVSPVMSVGGARASERFFAPFRPGGSHEGYLEPIELRLIAEWLDIGAQYYNNPFDLPQN